MTSCYAASGVRTPPPPLDTLFSFAISRVFEPPKQLSYSRGPPPGSSIARTRALAHFPHKSSKSHLCQPSPVSRAPPQPAQLHSTPAELSISSSSSSPSSPSPTSATCAFCCYFSSSDCEHRGFGRAPYPIWEATLCWRCVGARVSPRLL